MKRNNAIVWSATAMLMTIIGGSLPWAYTAFPSGDSAPIKGYVAVNGFGGSYTFFGFTVPLAIFPLFILIVQGLLLLRVLSIIEIKHKHVIAMLISAICFATILGIIPLMLLSPHRGIGSFILLFASLATLILEIKRNRAEAAIASRE